MLVFDSEVVLRLNFLYTGYVEALQYKHVMFWFFFCFLEMCTK